MNVLEILMQTDAGKFKTAEKRVKIERLSEITGEEVIFTLRRLSLGKIESIRQQQSDETNDFKLLTVAAAIKDPDIEKLGAKFDTYTPTDTLEKLLLPAEIEQLYTVVSDMAGYGSAAIEEIKKK